MNKAIVYLWPLLSKPAQQFQEARLIDAGYRDKQRIEVSGHKIWKVT